MIQHVPTMTNDELRDRVARYDRQSNLSTADWQVYEACRTETRKRESAPPWECPTCDGEGMIHDAEFRVCPSCNGRRDLLPEPEL